MHEGLNLALGKDIVGTVPVIAGYKIESRISVVPSGLQTIRQLHFGAGFLLISIGLLIGFGLPRRPVKKDPQNEQYRVTGVSDERAASHFQPIATQDELLFSKQDAKAVEPVEYLEKAADLLGRAAGHMSRIKSRL